MSKPVIFAMAIALVCSTSDARAAQPSRPEIESHHANFLLRITWDASLIKMSDHLLHVLVNSSSVRDKSVRHVLGLADGDATNERVTLMLEMLDGNTDPFEQGTAFIQLTVDLDPNLPPKAEPTLKAICGNLEAALRQICESPMVTIRERLAECKRHQRALETEMQQLMETQRALIEQSGAADLRSDATLEGLASVQEKLRSLQMQRLAHEARRTALLNELSQARKGRSELQRAGRPSGESPRNDGDAGSGDDVDSRAAGEPAIIGELRELVRIREKQMERIERLVKEATASENEIMSCREALAHARINLLQKQQELAEGAPGDRMSELNRALSEIQMEMEAAQAQITFLQDELAAAGERLRMSAQYETGVSIRLPMLVEQLSEAARQCSVLERQVASLTSPKFEIIGVNGE